MPRARARGRGHHAAARRTGPYNTRCRSRSLTSVPPLPLLASASSNVPSTDVPEPSPSGQPLPNLGLEEFITMVRTIVREERAVDPNPASSVAAVPVSLTLTNTMAHSQSLPSIVSPRPGLPVVSLPSISGTSLPLTAGECVCVRMCVCGHV